MNTRLNQIFRLLSANFALYLSISFGFFLFVLFFQPFPLDHFDFNNRLILIGGVSCVILLLMAIIRTAFVVSFYDKNTDNNGYSLLNLTSNTILWILISVALAFYLRYVGSVRITFFMMVKICILSLAVPVVLRLHDRINQLKQQNLSLINDKKSFQKQVEVYAQHNLKKTVDFISENGLETINLLVEDVVFIRSADNYVEILFKESGSLRKKLIRNTLKNIEQQISSYSNFVRCHRICIINTNYIETLSRNYSNYWISVRGFDEKIPVSRQYLLKIKEIV